MRLELHAITALTMRYTPLINERCRIYRAGDPRDDLQTIAGRISDKKNFPAPVAIPAAKTEQSQKQRIQHVKTAI